MFSVVLLPLGNKIYHNMEFAHDCGHLRCFSSNCFPKAKKLRANCLIHDDIMLHIFTCSSDEHFVNTEAAPTLIFLECKKHLVPVLSSYDQVEVKHMNLCKQSNSSTKAALYLFSMDANFIYFKSINLRQVN